jgi:hypothetical protein
MDKSEVSAILKRNVGGIVAGVVALGALGTIFFYVNPKFEELESEMTASASKASSLDRLVSMERPNVSTQETDVVLTGFPTESTLARGQAFNRSIIRQADDLLSGVVQRNKRLPLGYQPQSNSPQAFEAAYLQAAEDWPLEGQNKLSQRNLWLLAYKAWINADGSFDDETGSYPPDTLQGVHRATRPPTQSSLQFAMDRTRVRIENAAPRDADGRPLNPEGLERQIEQELTELARGLKYTRAVDHLIYIDESAGTGGLSLNPVADLEVDPSPEQIFEAQVQLWVQEQVLARLTSANLQFFAANPDVPQNVVGAPVKHLVSLDVPDRFVTSTPIDAPDDPESPAAPAGPPAGFDTPYGPIGNPYMQDFDPTGGAGAGPAAAPRDRRPDAGRAAPRAVPRGGRDTPTGPTRGGVAGRATQNDEPEADVELTPVTYDPAAELERDYRYSPSGRLLHTPFYDAVQFTMELRVSTEELPYVLRQLQAESFVTVLNVFKVESVDPFVALDEGYVYGDQPVSQVTLQCEMLLLRSWTVDLMPEVIRQELQVWEP